MRYKLAPSLIAFGRTVQTAGFPLTARCDLVWPSHPEANDPSQYLHLNTTLIAPLEGDSVGFDKEKGTLPNANKYNAGAEAPHPRKAAQ